MSQFCNSNNYNNEISVRDILNFLSASWKTLTLTGLLGCIFACGYVLVSPNQYQAVSRIKMAEIILNKPELPLLIEEPDLLILRMRLPSSYSPDVTSACGGISADELMSRVNFSILKNSKIVELSVKGHSPEAAVDCSQTIYESIRQSQRKIAEIFIEEATAKIVGYKEQLQSSKSFIASADASNSSVSATYLSTRDEIKFFNVEINRLKDMIFSAKTREASLLTPIYSSKQIASPKRAVIFTVGLMAGLFVGLLLTLAKRINRDSTAA